MKSFSWLLVCLSVLLAHGVALACTPPYPGCYLQKDLAFDVPFPTDGVVAFVMGFEDAGPDDVHVTLTDSLGAEVPGALEEVFVHPGNPEPPGGGEWRLLAWRPASPLAPLATYDLHITCSAPEGVGEVVDETGTLTTAEGPATSVAAPDVYTSKWEPWTYAAGEELCCDLETCWVDTCTGEDICSVCWKELWASGPALQLTFGPGAGGPPAHQLVHVVSSVQGDGEPLYSPAAGPLEATKYLATSDPGPWCVSVRSRSLISGAESEPTEVCVGEGAVLPAPKAAETPPECKAAVADPDPGADAGAGDAGGADAGAGEADGSGDVGVDAAVAGPDAADAIAADSGGDAPTPDGTPDGAPAGDAGNGTPDVAAGDAGGDTKDAGSGGAGAGQASSSDGGCSGTGGPSSSAWMLLALLVAAGWRRRCA